jgi:hypothetical protein
MASPDSSALQTVKLKILYTFDADSKDNHLTRWPQSLDVNTCFIDAVTQIGVVDLRTCLEAVVTASPELTSLSELDYTVYAYDYSEEDTPLVGQGMLSKTLANNSMGSDSDAMVTGRITKGLMGLLSKNAQPTLEVKLRLKPVSLSMPRQRSGSVSSLDGRPAWGQNSEAAYQQRSASPMDTTGLENVQRMLNESAPSQQRIGQDSYGGSRPGSRAGTPVTLPYDLPPQPTMEEFSRPGSRASHQQPMHARHDSFSGYYSAEENFDDSHPRKRAKISRVNTASKDNFNIERQPDDLRTMAGKASSVRLHRPTPLHPLQQSAQTGPIPNNVSLNEEPVRPPTPVPNKTARPRGRPRKTPSSNLAPYPALVPTPTLAPAPVPAATQAPAVVAPKPIQPTRNNSAPRVPGPFREIQPAPPLPSRLEVPENAVMSPEDPRLRSVSSTPANLPSSPPVMPARTSPTLPPIHDSHDSGFGSGNLDDDIFGDDGLINFDNFEFNKEMEANVDLDLSRFDDKQYPPVFDDATPLPEPQDSVIHEKQQNPVSPIPDTVDQQAAPVFLPPPARSLERSHSSAPMTRSQVSMSSPKLAPAPYPRARQITEEQAREQLRIQIRQLPPVPVSDPGSRKLGRSQTWAPDSDAIMSEAPTSEEKAQQQRSKTNKKVGKEQTQARLENAIAAGEMPPFCDNCGAIETPAWRRAYAKTFDSVPFDDVETDLTPGAVVFKHALSHDDNGKVKSWRGFKVDRTSEDEADGWHQINLCNRKLCDIVATLRLTQN